MENEVPKTAMPMVAGIFCIVSGVFRFFSIFAVMFLMLFTAVIPAHNWWIPIFMLSIIGILLLITAVLSVVGGIYAIQRKNFIVAVVGSVASLLPFEALGIAALVLVIQERVPRMTE